MDDQRGTQTPGATDRTEDVANNEVGPTEKLREGANHDEELSVPGAQNPASEEIKNEQSPNTE